MDVSGIVILIVNYHFQEIIVNSGRINLRQTRNVIGKLKYYFLRPVGRVLLCWNVKLSKMTGGKEVS
jgi:hypothetical protein